MRLALGLLVINGATVFIIELVFNYWSAIIFNAAILLLLNYCWVYSILLVEVLLWLNFAGILFLLYWIVNGNLLFLSCLFLLFNYCPFLTILLNMLLQSDLSHDLASPYHSLASPNFLSLLLLSNWILILKRLFIISSCYLLCSVSMTLPSTSLTLWIVLACLLSVL